MSKQRQLGDILVDSGRITRNEVESALAHQRSHGGYFGEAAVALGLLSREEIDWALASQLDLPFIFPNADAVDREAAMLVPPDWALAHLAVPIVRTADSVTVAVADPLATEVVGELRQRTGLDVEMALASAARIRELIRAVYGDSGAPGAEAGPPVQLVELLGRALAQGAERIGMSDRGAGALGWYSAAGAVHRQPLQPGWDESLGALLDPSPFDSDRGDEAPVTQYQGTLVHRGAYLTVEVQVMRSLGGREILIRPANVALNRTSGVVMPPAIAADLRMIARSGHARVGLAGGGPLDDLLPQLPELALGARVRAVHVSRGAAGGEAAGQLRPGVYTLSAAGVEGDLVERVRDFRFDALTTDLSPEDDRLGDLLGAAPIAFMREPAESRAVDLNWRLTVTTDGEAFMWDLSPINW